mmetsp:Transcript_5328/g.10907  ORF Transcript_5328/g.10907 Transcript_5328/m.10907 type:complete len:186 (-) Transcript_5328:226-783(-)|eukprot:CAMPEP_0171336944 /NCGR_PEP_ID=MMETSP0878-20121228/6377_1 /TAXON_ID=67004 /ORGANISM="Thalassiosira weissflogii, Strain CCMP1336" /LENGTH=185 /DNA_ID=CAMNT_0011838511 /DNA_START=265 /DNA_END=822 /DNA_ORIENTATION=-
MATPEEEGLKGNKKGRPIWTFIKNASLAMTVLMFIFTTVLILDAYKFVTIRHAKFARNKLLSTLRHMDPSLIESHTGLKVLTTEEYESLQSNLEKARADIREVNTKVQEKFSEVLKASMELQNKKKDIEELKKLIAEKEAEKKDAPAEAPKEEAAAETAPVEPAPAEAPAEGEAAAAAAETPAEG